MSPGRPCAVLVLAASCACALDSGDDGSGSAFLPNCEHVETVFVADPDGTNPADGRYAVRSVDGEEIVFESSEASFTLRLVGVPPGAAAFRIDDELDAVLTLHQNPDSTYVVLTASDGALFFEGGGMSPAEPHPRRIELLRNDREPTCSTGTLPWAPAVLHFAVDEPIDLPVGPSSEVEVDGVAFLATTLAARVTTAAMVPPDGSGTAGSGSLIRKALE